MSHNLITIIVAAVFVCPTSHATDYPVSDTASFENALLTIAPGDTITWADGIYTDIKLDFTASGIQDSAITLRAATPGGVSFRGQSWLKINGGDLLVTGFDWIAGTVDPLEDGAVMFEDGSHDCRLTECRVRSYGGWDKKYVIISGHHHRMDHCDISYKSSLGTMVGVELDTLPAGTSADHLIDQNYFSFNTRSASTATDFETIRIGDSATAHISAGVVIEKNFFFRCDGELELISNKSSNSIIRQNVFVECRGGVSLRHGRGNVVEGNYFFGNLIPETLGVRVINEDQTVINNYFQDLESTDSWDAAITIFSGIANSPVNGYNQVRNAVIAHNTFVNNRECIRVANQQGETTTFPPPGGVNTAYQWTEPPIDSFIANNLFYENRGPLITEVAPPINMTYEGNLAYRNGEPYAPMIGFIFGNPLLSKNEYDYTLSDPMSAAVDSGIIGSYPTITNDIHNQARDIHPDIGSDELTSGNQNSSFVRPEAVGASWISSFWSQRGVIEYPIDAFAPLTIQEPLFGSTNVALPVARTLGTTGAIAVNYDLIPTNGTPINGLDYSVPSTVSNRRITFPANTDLEQNILFPIFNDGIHEEQEEFLVQLRWPSNNAALGFRATRKVIIKDSNYDQWLSAHFGNRVLLPEADVNSDPDGDHIPNFMEFELKGNPRQQDETILPAFEFSETDGPTLCFQRDIAAQGVTTTIEAADTPSQDDQFWQFVATRTATGLWTAEPSIEISEDANTGDVRVTGWKQATRKFLRVRMNMPGRLPRYASSDEHYQWIEAETGMAEDDFAPWETIPDATASWNLAISPTLSSTLSVPEDGQLNYPFTLAEPTTVAVWMRLLAPDSGGNSVYVKGSNQLEWKQWNFDLPYITTWTWVKWSELTLPAGTHHIDVAYRESHFALDKLLVTDDLTFVPTAFGTN